MDGLRVKLSLGRKSGIRGGKSVGLGSATEYSVASSVVTSVLGRRSGQPNVRILRNACAVMVVMG